MNPCLLIFFHTILMIPAIPLHVTAEGWSLLHTIDHIARKEFSAFVSLNLQAGRSAIDEDTYILASPQTPVATMSTLTDGILSRTSAALPPRVTRSLLLEDLLSRRVETGFYRLSRGLPPAWQQKLRAEALRDLLSVVLVK